MYRRPASVSLHGRKDAADIFPPEIGGPATYSYKIAHKLYAKGHTVLVTCYSRDAVSGESNPFPVVRIRISGIKAVHYIKYFINLFKVAKHADVIYAQGPVASGFPSIIAGKVLRKKVVIKVVGDYALVQHYTRR